MVTHRCAASYSEEHVVWASYVYDHCWKSVNDMNIYHLRFLPPSFSAEAFPLSTAMVQEQNTALM